MHTDDPFQAVAARHQAAEALQAWCRMTVRRYRLLAVLGGAIYCAFLLALIGILSGMPA